MPTAQIDPSYKQGDDDFVAFVDLCSVRTLLGAPLLKKGELIGMIGLYRQQVHRFTDQQVELVRNFAAQAVIAIENARLLNELRQRTDDLTRRTADLTEALEQQTATSEVLQTISSSPGDLEPVFASMLRSAARICDANFGNIFRWDGEVLHLAATYNTPPAFFQLRSRSPLYPNPDNPLGRLVATKGVVHIANLAEEPLYTEKLDPNVVAAVELGGIRTFVAVPMLKENELIGAIIVYRQEVRPFTDKQIELVQNFAAQAVIAIENARLLNELRQRTTDLTELLEQQTATSEVLQVINSTPGDPQPVFEAMLEKAVRICDAKFGNIHRWDGNALHLMATHNTPSAFAEYRGRSPWHPKPRNAVGRTIATKTVVHVADLAAEEAYTERRDPSYVAAVELGGVRTFLAVPMLKENELIGVFTVYRQEVRPFTDKQIALVTNFAAQAVIAIENARLLNELRESLDRQTATADVLQSISSSPGDLQPVFDRLLANATRLCGAAFGNLLLGEGGRLYRVVAMHNPPPAYAELRRREPVTEVGPETPLARAAALKTFIQVSDFKETVTYVRREPSSIALGDLGGARTFLVVPMLKENEMIGAIAIYRQEVRPFTDKQVELVKNFAAQAVIAIENVRLLNELRESLQEQTATAEVLQVISGSPGDLEPVFATMLEKAVRICDATFGNIYRWDGDALQLVATHNTPLAYAEHRRHSPFHADQNNSVARMITSKKVVHLLDAAENDAYLTRSDPTVVAAVELGGIRSALIVPMLKEDELVGAFIVSRQEVRPFSEKQIALVTNFAAQAVIAIENARLLSELRERTNDLTELLEQQTATSDVLQVINSTPGDLQPVFATMLEKAVSICDATFGNIYRWDGDALHLLATQNTPLAYAEARRRSPVRPNPNNIFGRMVATKTVVHVPDAVELREQGNPEYVTAVELGGVRTCLAVPMLKEHELVGSISLFRQEVLPFTDKQIALITNFASQAVIAIENARLLKELRERTSELEVQSREVAELNQRLEQRVADQVGEIERMSRLRRFLPPQVADLIVASGAEKQLESHRREITALFCDLRGFTGFSESSDPEDVMTLLRDYHAAIGEIIVKYNGTLERYAGDGVMVVFNDPIPVDNPALQAAQMALEMRVAIGALTEKWRQLGHEIGFGIGIAHGYATLGTIGFEGRHDYAAIGTVSNVASRLCDEAKPGQILISPRVLMAVKDAITVEPVGEFELKGIRRPIAAYNVLAAAPPNA